MAAMGRGLVQLAVVGLGLALFFGCLPTVSGWYNHRVHVHVNNILYPGTNMTLHCKSKDDDLGEQIRTFGQDFEWSFGVNFWDTTLFWCNIWWSPSPGRLIEGGFHIYDSKRDIDDCGKMCLRFVKPDGIYFNFPAKGGPTYSELVYPWPTQTDHRQKKLTYR
ncbi:Plant self-incompatibility S1 [Macleaya cordata]|uniref:S-protein homolog n=1 Tax=Macleaya cordata TaxID=56857 RepID=A0A200QS36_MACCD|nr:Plant self-incompatibility S1 [Macleaya cordata]